MPMEPEFSTYTDPQERPKHVGMKGLNVMRDMYLGGLAGGTLGGAAGLKLAPHLSPLHPLESLATGAVLGGGLGIATGALNGAARMSRRDADVDDHLRDRERAHEHRMEMADLQHTQRKELLNMRKQASTFDGVMLAAMADELQHIHQEKVAINLPQVGNFLGNIGSKALSGVTGAVAKHAPGMAQTVNAGMLRAGQAVGGGANLSKLVGGGLVGGGALAAGGLAGRAMGGGQR